MEHVKFGKYTILFLMLCTFFVAGESFSSEKKDLSVTVINPVVVPQGKEKEALDIWEKYSEYFGKQPGFISAKLHRSVNPKAKFHLISVAKWKSSKDFLRALNNEDIKKIGNGFPEDMPHYPSMYEIIRK